MSQTHPISCQATKSIRCLYPQRCARCELYKLAERDQGLLRGSVNYSRVLREIVKCAQQLSDNLAPIGAMVQRFGSAYKVHSDRRETSCLSLHQQFLPSPSHGDY